MASMSRLPLLLAGFAGLNLALVAASPGCGSTVVEITPGEGGGGEGGGSTTEPDGGFIIDGSADAKDALPDYVDPGCPDAGPPPTQFQCDPYDQNNGDCFMGEACYIFVQYPQEKCEQEIYGSFCAIAGDGDQGDGCNGPQDCGAGLVCVITGFGTQCVQFCPLSGDSGCPPGLTCEAIDVEGFGGCF